MEHTPDRRSVIFFLSSLLQKHFLEGLIFSRYLGLIKRPIFLIPRNTEEKDWKRIPMHHELVPIIAESLDVIDSTSFNQGATGIWTAKPLERVIKK